MKYMLALLALLCLPAQGATIEYDEAAFFTSLGAYDPAHYDGVTFQHTHAGNPVFDVWTFDLVGEGRGSISAAVTVPIQDFEATLLDFTHGLVLGSASGDAWQMEFDRLAAAQYVLLVAGATDSFGAYTGSLTFAPLPESGTLGLAIVGLLGLAVTGRKRYNAGGLT